MSTIYCPGGHSFSDSEIPSRVSFRLIPDATVEGLVSDVIDAVRGGDDVESTVTFKILSSGASAYICPHCGRFLVFRDNKTAEADSYRPEKQ